MVPSVLGPFEAAGEWHRAVVAPGTGDNMAGALGVGLRPGDVVVSIGTSGTVYCVSDTPTADPSGIVAGFADATGRQLPSSARSNATKVTEAVRRLLGVDHDEFRPARPRGRHRGRRAHPPPVPGRRAHPRPADGHGRARRIRSDVGREQLARAAVEGVVCGQLDGLDAIASFAPNPGRLVLVGGGGSRAYRQTTGSLDGANR